MKKFLIKIAPYFVAVMIVFAVLGSYADGNTDDNYMHFAVKKPQNIILGDSRGAQGVVPEVLKNKLSVPFDNFSLNIVQSPYGQIYLKALKRKLDPDTKNGIFILTVNPWSLSIDNAVKRKEDFPEVHSPLNNMYFYDWSPNYEYLLKNYTRSWFKIYSEREAAVGKSNTFQHKDGWMEVNGIDMHKDSVAVRTGEKIAFYNMLAEKQNFSKDRIDAFNEIIDYLKSRGTVYLVRIPTSEQLKGIETKKFPEFNTMMHKIEIQKGVKFYDFSGHSSDYLYTDGNHMYSESGKIFTSRIADSILLDKKKLK